MTELSESTGSPEIADAGVGAEQPQTLPDLISAAAESAAIEPILGENDAGFWESRDLARLDDAILESAVSYWYDWRKFSLDWYGSPVAGCW